MEAACAPLREHPHVSDVRRTGMIVAIEMVRDRATNSPFDWRERRGHRVSRYGLEHEIFLRPLGDVIYFMPPYVINEAEINLLVRVVVAGIDLATM
jgi:adenosylmethionine-8-amino-7-oxononanoate aminotransferase